MAKQTTTRGGTPTPPAMRWDEAQPPAVMGNGAMVDFQTVIADAVKTGNVDIVNKLIDASERMQKIIAERAFKADFVTMWPKLPQILKEGEITLPSKSGEKTVMYAKREDMDEVIRPILAEHGFAFSFRDVSTDLTTVKLEGELMHRGGHSKYAVKLRPPDTGPGRNAIQSLGSSDSYTKRYLIEDLLDLVRRGMDDDGKSSTASFHTSPPPPPKPRQRPADRPTSEIEWVQKSVAAIDQRLDAGSPGEWRRLIEVAAERAPSLAALNDLDRMLRWDIDHADTPPDVRVDLNAAIGLARKRLTAVEADAGNRLPFDYPVLNAHGEVDAHSESFTNPLAWATQFMVLWGKCTRPGRENLLQHNADAIEDVRASGVTAAIKMLADAVLPAEEPTEAVTPPAESTPSHGVFDDDDEPYDPDRAWLANTLAKLTTIPNTIEGRGVFDRLVAEVRPRMRDLQRSNEDVFREANEAFTAKHNAIPGGSR